MTARQTNEQTAQGTTPNLYPFPMQSHVDTLNTF